MKTQNNFRWPKPASVMQAFHLSLLLLASTSLLITSPIQAGEQQNSNSVDHGTPVSAVDSGSIHDGSGSVAEDLIASESSQSPASESNELKAFTSGQALRPDPLQQMAASVAPSYVIPPQGPSIAQAGAPMHKPAFQQQSGPMGAMGPFVSSLNPQQMAALRQHQQHQKALNPFIAAALAGNYGVPAQQQMAAASMQHPRIMAGAQMGHPQHAQQVVGPHHHHQAPNSHNQIQQQTPMQMVHQARPAQMMQAQAQPQQFSGIREQNSIAAAESSIRNNIIPAPTPTVGDEINEEQAGVSNSGPAQGLSVVSNGQQQQQQQQSGLGQGTGSQSELASSASSTSTAVVQQQNTWPQQNPDVPKITNLEVKCEKNLMKVSVEFDKVFNGVIFSKGHYSQGQCVHVGANSGKQQAYFDISINSCGTQGNTQNGLYGMGGNTGSGTYFENTIVIQYDPNVQEVYDHARKLRCTWHDQYEKAVTFRPFPVDMLDIVRADFAGDNVGCWMQIQVGKGPWASEVAGIVKIGQTMTMVLAIKDEENKFDMLVRNCFAHDGKRGPIELVDKAGCITRPKLMSRFTKIKNFGSSATVLSYAHFQAFKFPDSMEVHFQCTIQICRHQCPEQCSAAGANGIAGSTSETYSESTISGTLNIGGPSQDGGSSHLRKFGHSGSLTRDRRDLGSSHRHGHPSHHHQQHRFANDSSMPMNKMVGVNRVIQVVSTGDLAFAIQQQNQHQYQQHHANGSLSGSEDLGNPEQLTQVDLSNQICMSSYNFVLSLVILVLLLLCSTLLAVSLYWRQVSLSRCSSSSKLLVASSQVSPTSTLRHSQLNQVPISNLHQHQHQQQQHKHHQHTDKRFV